MEDKQNPFVWIEIPVTDIGRAEQFYENLLGYTFDRQPEKMGYTLSWFPMHRGAAYGSAGALIMGDQCVPSMTGTTPYLAVPNTVNETLEKAKEMGVTVLCPRMDIGEHGFFALIQDSEGNKIAIHSMKG